MLAPRTDIAGCIQLAYKTDYMHALTHTYCNHTPSPPPTCPCVGSLHSLVPPQFTQVLFTLSTDAISTNLLPSAEPKYLPIRTERALHDQRDSSVIPRLFLNEQMNFLLSPHILVFCEGWSCDPVTILTTPPGRSDVSNTWTGKMHASCIKQQTTGQ